MYQQLKKHLLMITRSHILKSSVSAVIKLTWS